MHFAMSKMLTGDRLLQLSIEVVFYFYLFSFINCLIGCFVKNNFRCNEEKKVGRTDAAKKKFLVFSFLF